MKHILEFNTEDSDDNDRLRQIMAINQILELLHKVEQYIFRPHRKHGYSDLPSLGANDDMNQLIENDNVQKAIGLLEDEYYSLKNDLGLGDLY